MTRVVVAVWMVALALCLAACATRQGPLRVGTKEFDEQRILAHMLAELARQQGMRALIVDCGDTYGCQDAMRSDRVDLMVEYTGTMAVLSGASSKQPQSDAKRYRELGLRWLGELGFDNTYGMVVPTARAAALQLRAIGDLSQLPGGIRVASPSSYARRPGDGLLPLLRRYGLQLAEPPLLLDQPGERYEAVLSGRADVAVAYSTDGALEGSHLRMLDDPLAFFPDYRAGVVARADVVENRPAVQGLVQKLRGKLDKQTMRLLNARVQTEGHDPGAVAESFLQQAGMIEKGKSERRETELYVVTHERDRLGPETAQARRAVDAAFTRRTVRTREVSDPFQQLADGSARLAVLGSERFFRPTAEGFERESRAEAVAVVGTRMLHLIRRGAGGRNPFAGKIGVAPEGSGGASVATRVLGLAGKEPAARATPAKLLEKLASGKLSGVLLLAEPPHPELAEAMAGSSPLTIRPVAERIEQLAAEHGDLPFLRAARIAAGTYPNQPEPVDTFGSQVVIAGPAAQEAGASRIGGPAAALRTAGLPLSPDEVDALLQATRVKELPDPVLPSPWTVGASGAERQYGPGAELDTGLNVAVWIFLGWLVYLLLRRERRRSPALPD